MTDAHTRLTAVLQHIRQAQADITTRDEHQRSYAYMQLDDAATLVHELLREQEAMIDINGVALERLAEDLLLHPDRWSLGIVCRDAGLDFGISPNGRPKPGVNASQRGKP